MVVSAIDWMERLSRMAFKVLGLALPPITCWVITIMDESTLRDRLHGFLGGSTLMPVRKHDVKIIVTAQAAAMRE